MYAVIETGGKQYRVQEGDVVFTDDGAKVGTPYVEGAKVAATTVKEGRGKKITVYKYKSKKGYHKKQGHRQYFTKLKIDSIQA